MGLFAHCVTPLKTATPKADAGLVLREPMMSDTEANARVVVVDDSRLIREIARDALEGLVHLECCANAEEALEALARESADLVISDLTMPGMTGIDLLERVRLEHPGTEFVLLTANATVESAIGALRMGAADYLIKPIQPENLALIVERILSQRRLLEENERLRDALATVESCRTLMRCLDPGELYVVVLDLSLHSLSRTRGMALFRRGTIPISDGFALRGFDENDEGRLRDVLVGEKPVNLDAVQEVRVLSESDLHDSLRGLGIETGPAVAVPLRGRETELGLLWIFEDGQPFDANEIERIRLIAGHAQLALHNAERYDHAKERAFVDDVTEVYNARYLLQATEREIQRAERYEKSLSVLFLDLDRFKLVNDRYGHLVGSQVLRQLSDVLAGCIRQVDTLARYGGDEFTILLTDTGLDVGLNVAERIRATVAETRFEGDRGSPIHLEISIGVATYPDHSEQRDALLDCADKAMYLAKSRGRNRVCSASDLAE
jgi:two-component system cell cycle response regulator